MNFFFRLNCSNKVGLGHFSRISKIANYIKKHKHSVYFVVDNINELKNINLVHQTSELYKKNKFKNEKKDAQLFLEKIKNKKKGYIFLDDYRLGNIWKKYLKNNGYKIIHFDDKLILNKYSDYIINYGINTFNSKQKFKNNYLLGPKYALIDDNSSNKVTKSKFFEIILYLGGAGNTDYFDNLSSEIKKEFLRKKIKNFEINIVLGPLVLNFLKFKSKYSNDKFINIISGETNLIKIFKKSDLFIGSAGTSIYETSYADIPSILFKSSDDQNDIISNLEKLGHYIYIEKKEFLDFKKVAKLSFLIFKNYKNVKKNFFKNKYKIDNQGSKRIFDSIINKYVIKNDYLKKENKIKKNKFEMAKITDMNKIYELRNERYIRRISGNTRIIKKIDHYLWWFENKDAYKIYTLKKQGKILMVYWYKIMKLGKKNYTFNGWYSSKELKFIELLYYIKKFNNSLLKKPQLICLTKKNNKLSLKIDQYLGYKKIVNINKDILKFLKGNGINLKNISLVTNKLNK